MNFLFHLHLSGNDPDLLTGNFMGDFVKGRLGDVYPHGVATGIMLHRRIDSFAQQHPLFRRSCGRISPQYGLWRGVLVDLFYDHFLSAAWDEWGDASLEAYLSQARKMIEERREWLPERLQSLLPVIFEDLIPSYCEIAGIGVALERMSRRVKRDNPLAGGEQELIRSFAELREDFRCFMPAAREFVSDFLGTTAPPA
ncbi:ACP phosphodiesterase [Geobacter sp. AOG2]|uniref:acyl carrier protein phosphodiesterase n=1 Tax=Geobacter sp. AOG2 TaxID=1566347 RepID=UPI001CC36332|nr:ACP phosphodiesterase [Geobacter sp. AOG2]GFE61247.1 ACP phosphodiesterase [Geobacter sp. AOG2]